MRTYRLPSSADRRRSQREIAVRLPQSLQPRYSAEAYGSSINDVGVARRIEIRQEHHRSFGNKPSRLISGTGYPDPAVK